MHTHPTVTALLAADRRAALEQAACRYRRYRPSRRRRPRDADAA